MLAFDHRVVDGADAARFMNVVKEALQAPDNMLMMM
jgi:pyruvate/2-oxoglutarate dehydrogenase complex dihydrolipoamide acyltransferase (E2) component